MTLFLIITAIITLTLDEKNMKPLTREQKERIIIQRQGRY